MAMDWWKFERNARDNGFAAVAGVDEAGRGPLAGPVVAAAVVLPQGFDATGVNDSKKLTPLQRDRIYASINDHALDVGVGIVDAEDIDRINILQASLLAMKRAVKRLHPSPDYLLIDGPYQVDVNISQEGIKKGDAKSVSIAAASIVAKVTRDQIMEELDRQYPRFGFGRHKGYPTRAHKEAIAKYGSCPVHRRTFKGVKEYLR